MTGQNPLCEACGKVCYKSVRHARLANAANGRTLQTYWCGGWVHVRTQRNANKVYHAKNPLQK